MADLEHELTLGLDHVGLAVRDLEFARAAYERLGFTLSPRSMHSGSIEPGGPVVAWGSGNHCAMFKHGYFEVLGLVEPDKPSNVKHMLDRYEGLHIVALRCPSADQAYSALHARGLKAAPPISLERDAAFGQDREMVRRAAFRNVYLDGEAFPESRFIVIQHLTPEVLWQPHLMDHPNGAEALVSVYFCVPDVSQSRNRLVPLFGPCSEEGNARKFALSRGNLRLLTESDIRNRVPVLRNEDIHRVAAAEISVSSLSRLKGLLDRNKVPYTEAPSLESEFAVWVGPNEACNTALAFSESKQSEEPQG